MIIQHTEIYGELILKSESSQLTVKERDGGFEISLLGETTIKLEEVDGGVRLSILDNASLNIIHPEKAFH